MGLLDLRGPSPGLLYLAGLVLHVHPPATLGTGSGLATALLLVVNLPGGGVCRLGVAGVLVLQLVHLLLADAGRGHGGDQEAALLLLVVDTPGHGIGLVDAGVGLKLVHRLLADAWGCHCLLLEGGDVQAPEAEVLHARYHTVTRLSFLDLAAALGALVIAYPLLALRGPCPALVRAPGLVAVDAVDTEHLALVAGGDGRLVHVVLVVVILLPGAVGHLHVLPAPGLLRRCRPGGGCLGRCLRLGGAALEKLRGLLDDRQEGLVVQQVVDAGEGLYHLGKPLAGYLGEVNRPPSVRGRGCGGRSRGCGRGRGSRGRSWDGLGGLGLGGQPGDLCGLRGLGVRLLVPVGYPGVVPCGCQGGLLAASYEVRLHLGSSKRPLVAGAARGQGSSGPSWP